MTDLERAIADELRLSDKASESLLPTIQRNIESARSELIRSGISETLMQTNVSLVGDCIICWVLSRMGDESDREWYLDVFRNQQENLRKSK